MIKKLKKSLNAKWGKDLRVQRIYSYYRNDAKKNECIRMIKENLGDGLSDKELRRHVRLMRKAYLMDMWSLEEYFSFRYYAHTKEERKGFVTNKVKSRLVRNVLSKEGFACLGKKDYVYQQYSQFYKRDILAITDPHSMRAEIEQFIAKHPTLVFKPTYSSCGNMVEIVHDATWEKIVAMAEQCTGDVMIEELIIQGKEMAVLHPESVNTLRITTLITDGRLHYFLTLARIGRGDSIIDNVSKGGLACAVDLESGKIFLVGDKMGINYERHPDNGIMLMGYQIPKWEEAKEMVETMARIRPDYRYMGWDLAYTDEGWVLVEVNGGAQLLGQQSITQKGIRDELLAEDKDCLKAKGLRRFL